MDLRILGKARGEGAPPIKSTTYWYALYIFLKKFLHIIRWIELLDEEKETYQKWMPSLKYFNDNHCI